MCIINHLGLGGGRRQIGSIQFRMLSELLRGKAGNLTEVPVKCGQRRKTCSGGNGVDGIIRLR